MVLLHRGGRRASKLFRNAQRNVLLGATAALLFFVMLSLVAQQIGRGSLTARPGGAPGPNCGYSKAGSDEIYGDGSGVVSNPRAESDFWSGGPGNELSGLNAEAIAHIKAKAAAMENLLSKCPPDDDNARRIAGACPQNCVESLEHKPMCSTPARWEYTRRKVYRLVTVFVNGRIEQRRVGDPENGKITGIKIQGATCENEILKATKKTTEFTRPTRGQRFGTVTAAWTCEAQCTCRKGCVKQKTPSPAASEKPVTEQDAAKDTGDDDFVF